MTKMTKIRPMTTMSTISEMRTTISNGHRDRDVGGDEDENEGSDKDEDEEKDDFFAVESGAVATRTKPCKGSWACYEQITCSGPQRNS